MQRLLMVTLMSALLLAGCNDQQDAMQASLDKIRLMVKQSALLAVQAACMDDSGNRADMAHAAAVMARNAMGGPEMAKIHNMMGKMQGMSTGDMKMKGDVAGGRANQTAEKLSGAGNMSGNSRSADMTLHADLHDAGEQIFSFLDSMNGTHALICAQTAAASMAATAAMLREANAQEALASAKKLDQSVTAILNGKHESSPPAEVKAFALALQRI